MIFLASSPQLLISEYIDGWDKHIIKKYNKILSDKEKPPFIAVFIEGGKKGIYQDYVTIDKERVKIVEINLGTPANSIKGLLLKEIRNARCIIVKGGNTFNICCLFHKNGWFNIVKEAVQENGSHYIGYSAGAIMATPTIMTAQWADTITNDFICNTRFRNGFGFVPFCLKPHSDSYLPDYYQYFKAFSMTTGLEMECIYETGAVIVDSAGETCKYGRVFTISSYDLDNLIPIIPKK